MKNSLKKIKSEIGKREIDLIIYIRENGMNSIGKII